MALTRNNDFFPFDLFDYRDFPGTLGEDIRMLSGLSMFPPYPWGQWLYANIINENVSELKGDFIEFGIGRGGMAFFLGLLAKKHGRKVYCFDSFAGLPNLDREVDNPVFKQGDYGPRTSLKGADGWLGQIEAKAQELGLGDTMVFIPGFFEDTIETLPEHANFSFVHIDCDLYSSVRIVLDQIYDRVTHGGYLVVDDFFHPAQGPLRAASNFFNARQVVPMYHVSFPYSVFVKKGEIASIDSTHFSLDGNIYSFDYLRNDNTLVDAVKASYLRASQAEANEIAAKNAELFLLLLQNQPSKKVSEIYEYWYALRDFWNGFQDHRNPRDTYLI